MSDNGIVHVTSAPYHPSSNGLAERAVQTFKNGLKRTKGDTIQERISKLLFTYRLTPQTTTGVAPSQLLMGRRPRSCLDRLFPSQRVEKHQSRQAEQHDNAKPLRSFKVDDPVYVKDFSTPNNAWIPGKVVKVTGPLSYHVEVQPGKVVRRHVDAVRKCYVVLPLPQSQEATTVRHLQMISIHLTYLLHPHPLHHLHQPFQLLHHLRARYHPNHQQQGNLVNIEYVHIVYHLEDLLA